MKCEKCNEKEANYYYKETVNGKTTERRLCMDCAREEGLDKIFETSRQEMFGDFEGMFGSFFRRDPWEEFFLPRPMGALSRTMLAPWRLAFPVLRIERTAPEAKEETAEAEAPADTVPEPDEELRRRRERNALREQMEAAAKAEDYERAIQLRDQLRAMDE